jgi:hypothetical protein
MICMAKEFVLIVAEGCAGCKEAKERVKGDKRFRVLDITENNEAASIALKLGINEVPTVVEIDHDANKICVMKDEKPRCAIYLDSS